MNSPSPISSDRALVDAARHGSEAAWTEFSARHLGAVIAVADTEGRNAAARAGAAMTWLRAELTAESSVPLAEDAPGVRALRARAIGALTHGTYGPGDRRADERGEASATTSYEQWSMLAVAFSHLHEAWQTVLWHRHVENAPTAEVAVLLGRSATAVIALQQTAERGLFDAYCAVALESDLAPECRPVVSQLGAYRRGTLPDAQARAIDAHIGSSRAPAGTVESSVAPVAEADGCADCRYRLALADGLGGEVPAAIVPSLTGLDAASYRRAIGARGAIVGASALAARRTDRANRAARIVGAAAVVLAVLAAAFLIRAPFTGLQPQLAEIIERSTPSTTMPGLGSPNGTTPEASGLPSRIEFVFPDSPQGAVYVPGGRPLDLSISLAAPGPVFAGGTGTIDAGLTNNDTVRASVRFSIRASSAVSFDELSEGEGTCRREDDAGATCAVTIEPGRTTSMSLRFAVSAAAPDRLVVDPGVASPSLEVPVRTVADLVVGTILRGRSLAVGGALGPCEVDRDCPDGDRVSSSASLDLPDDVDVRSALLVWDGSDSGEDWSGELMVTDPSGNTRLVGAAESTDASAPGVAPFRSTADVTDLVRAGGGGEYAVERSSTSRGVGSWSLVVVVAEPEAPRRLVTVVAPTSVVTVGAPFAADWPVAGSESTSGSPRHLELMVQATETQGHTPAELGVDGTPLGGDDPFGIERSGRGGVVGSYDLEISATEDTLPIVVSTSAGALRVTLVAVTLDLPT